MVVAGKTPVWINIVVIHTVILANRNRSLLSVPIC